MGEDHSQWQTSHKTFSWPWSVQSQLKSVCVQRSTEYKVWVSDKCDVLRVGEEGERKKEGEEANFLVWWVMITDPGRDLNAIDLWCSESPIKGERRGMAERKTEMEDEKRDGQ